MSSTESSQLPDSAASVTLRDVAKRLGVSHVTVSLALRGSPEISASRREQIRIAAVEMGYIPNAMAAALANLRQSSRVKPIRAGLAWINLWPDPKKLYNYAEFKRYWQGATLSAEGMGYRLEEFVCDKSLSLSRLQRILTARGISGILIPPHHIDIQWGSFPWERFSVVRFGRTIATPRVHMVTADQVANTIRAFNEIRDRGYRRIGYVSGPPQAFTLFECGFLGAQRLMPARDRLPIFHTDSTVSPSCQAEFARWLRKHKPDAILSEDASTSRMLEKAGYRVPEDIGLAVTSVLDGNADSGIYQNPEEIGRVGVLVVASLIHDHAKGIPPIFRQILVEGKWVDGTSLPRR